MLFGDIRRISDEQAFVLGHDRRSRPRDFGSCAIFSEHVELQSVGYAASAGFHIGAAAVLFDFDTVVQLPFGIRADQSFEFGPDAASVNGTGTNTTQAPTSNNSTSQAQTSQPSNQTNPPSNQGQTNPPANNPDAEREPSGYGHQSVSNG